MSLLDTIKSNLGQAAKPAQSAAGPASTTASVQQLVKQAAAPAKAGASSRGGLETQPERVAAAQERMGLEQVGQEAKQAAIGLDQAQQAQTQQVQAQESQLNEQRLNQQSQMNQQIAGILQDFQQNQGKMDMEDEKARVQFVTSLMRLSDDKYINNLQNEGMKARLNNSLEFKRQLQENIFADEKALLQNNLAFRSLLNADERDFKAKIADMDINFALTMLTNQNRAQAQAQVWSSAPKVATATVDVYSAYEKNKAAGQTEE